jgi:exosortase C (VPDSG-CTERM-specific)
MKDSVTNPAAEDIVVRTSGGEPLRSYWLKPLLWLLVLILFFIKPLSALAVYALGSDLNSHIVLVPFIAGYVLSLRWRALPLSRASSYLPAAVLGAIGGAFLVAAIMSTTISWNDHLALETSAFLCLLWASGFVVLGREWMRAAAFPLAFLIFIIPMPEAMVDWLETASKYASADAAGMFFTLFGVPNVREGVVFHLPRISIQVATECSGIRSSWVLFITSLLAAQLFLRSNWRRAILVAFVIPLGVIRNGFRIAVIGWLCVHYGPHMIDSPIHHRGGPIFFVLSLGPLFALLWSLRRGDVDTAPASK